MYICKEIIYKSVTRDLAQSLERPLSGTQVSDTYIAFHRFDIFPALIKTWSAVAFIISFPCLEL